MSAAEPIRPEPHADAGPGRVLAFRRPRPGRETRVPDQPTGPGPLGPELTSEQKLAASLERAFADHARSLTDPDTALDFTITLGIVITALNGAREQGKLSTEEFDRLNSLVAGMLQAPRLLA